MYVDRSEEGSGSQNLSKGERLRNVFIVFGVVAAIVLVSHILYANSVSSLTSKFYSCPF